MRHGSENRVFCKRQATPDPGELVGSRTGAMLRRCGLAVALRFL